MRIVFSRDRAAQLDLLLTSFERNAPAEETVVIYRATTMDYLAGYAACQQDHPSVRWKLEGPRGSFEEVLRWELVNAADGLVTFLCDDDVLYRAVDTLPTDSLAAMPRLLTFSLRLGLIPDVPEGPLVWDWTALDPHDHGYPGSIDGHTFRAADVLRMIEGQTIENPLLLETILARRVSALAEERPLMACYPEQALVGVPVNSVADATRTAGQTFPQTAESLNARYLAGDRIDLDALDFSRVDGCLYEMEFAWERAA